MPIKILVIEDEPAIADNITYALKSEGFKPIWCSTGEEAYSLAMLFKAYLDDYQI